MDLAVRWTGIDIQEHFTMACNLISLPFLQNIKKSRYYILTAATAVHLN